MDLVATSGVMFWKLCAPLVVFLVALHRVDTLSLVTCPDGCHCEGNAWNCTDLKLAELWAENPQWTGGPHVRSLSLRDTVVNLEQDMRILFPNLEELELGPGCDIQCPLSSPWLLEWSGQLLYGNEPLCAGPSPNSGIQLSKMLTLMGEVRPQCPDRCSCGLASVPRKVTGDLQIAISVNCSNKSYHHLPPILPANFTIYLDMSNNRVEDVSQLATDPMYSHVKHLNLSRNRIRSIAPLENTFWLGEFGLLNLQNNLLEEIPTQALTNAFRNQDSNGVRMYLGGNPFKCDCITVTQFQSFIAKHKELVKDVNKVTCGSLDSGSDTSLLSRDSLAGAKLVKIELASVCLEDETAGNTIISLMDVLNIILAISTLAIVLKLFYDYRAYRKTGQLPWLATKLP